MAEQAWRAAWQRWGNSLWGLALLRWNNRATAQQALVRAFERVYTAETPPADPHTALLQAIFPVAPPRLSLHACPRAAASTAAHRCYRAHAAGIVAGAGWERGPVDHR